MNIEIANRLAELRKKSGYSQEELAEKLGLSRQAVSKWERAEASPDTDNLILLAKLYGVSLDDLLNTEESAEDLVRDNKEREQEKKDDTVVINTSGIHIQSKDGDRVEIADGKITITDKDGNPKEKSAHSKWRKKHPVLAAIFSSGAFVLLGLIGYILLGFLAPHGWVWGWTLILDGIVLSSIIPAIVEKRFCSFCYPVLVTSAYCTLSFFGSWYGFQSWEFWWFLFLTIPVYYILFGGIDKAIHHDKDDEDEEDDE